MIRPPLILVVALLLAHCDTPFTAITFAAAEPDHQVTVQGLPAHMRVDERLVDLVRGMLRTSPTFRDQVRRLGRSRRLRVRVVLNTESRKTARTSGAAECVISRYQYGLITAEVRLWSWDRVPELLAHELEHVAEYLEGTQYRVLSTRPSSRIWMLSRGHFETARAIAVGEDVGREASPWALARR